MTIRHAVDLGIRELQAAHTHDPEGCARFLLRHVLQRSSPQSSTIGLEIILVTNPDFLLSTKDIGLYKDMLLRRKLREPVWYITREAYFWKDEFYVDHRVLIPRPETELLVEKAITWITDRTGGKPFTVIDVGTGAGAIAISLYKELVGFSPITVYASDISPEAIEVAQENARRLGADRIQCIVGDALEPFSQPVDLVIGNPPYIPTESIGGLSYDIHHFEPRVALDGGIDGLDVHRKILEKAKKLIRSGGAIFLEIGRGQGPWARKIASTYFPTAIIEVTKDYDGNDRILFVQT
jgi:release factor glutamine methyltransferase